ncbi:hypothetical protein SCO11_09640 [Legionella pneumophila serogroup 1]|uniref:hypothetical protein n=1 Tax=Legionella pneumophila TaxID=446 RepID=UPI0005B3AD69|nr:hypothetical protein [Legionella pneumophila]ANN91269.1 hypothetical protein A9P85_00965 [Legionella pneumophila]MCZ4679296.1 hypothetical protein [Legionella pneumophila]MCZ4749267.1 hypothetical protein [Legionella pneumophila]MDW8863630.1 hypothetical protein [Legionella pneumophila]MDW8888223.1 hypothetical protein [Legionella pneumophila]
MNEISKDEYLEHVERNLVPNSREEAYFESENYKRLGVIVKDLTDNDYQAITHKRVNINEYEFENSEHNLKSYDEAYEALEKLMSDSG